MAKKEVVLGITGSIAIYKACDLIRLLRQEDINVNVVMTESAQKFMSPLVFGSLSANKVYSQMFAEPQVWEIEHLSLADKADLVLLAPATANIINKIACGICDDLLSSVVLATKAPVVFAPAMNENMYENKITQENIRKLKGLGYRFIGPTKGKLANGKIGIGHLASVDEIVKEAKKILMR